MGSPLGRHQWDVPVSDVTNGFIRTILLSLLFSNFGIMFIKISLLVFYLRIFKPVLWARIAIWSGLVAVLIFYVACNIVLLAVCVPKSGTTYVELTTTTNCTTVEFRISLAVGWFGTFLDFYILAIPIRLISTLMLNKQRKIGILAIFMTGLL